MRRRRPRPPDAVVSALDLVRGERLLGWASGVDGAWYVGSTDALYLPLPEGGYRRVPWEQVGSAEWQQETDRLAIVEVPQPDHPSLPEQVTVFEVAEPGQLLELIRERVTKSIVWTSYAPVRGRSGVTVVARRSPSAGGPVAWSVSAPGLDLGDPAVRRAAERLLDAGARELANLE